MIVIDSNNIGNVAPISAEGTSRTTNTSEIRYFGGSLARNEEKPAEPVGKGRGDSSSS